MANKELNSITTYGRVSVVRNNNNEWAVLDINGNEIVPFGKYAWIDGFDSGLARVRTHGVSCEVKSDVTAIYSYKDGTKLTNPTEMKKDRFEFRNEHPDECSLWGIINEDGEEVLPTAYAKVWNFLGKGRESTTVERLDGTEFRTFFESLPGSTYYTEVKYGSYWDDNDYDDCLPSFCDAYGNFDEERYMDAVEDGLIVPEDW